MLKQILRTGTMVFILSFALGGCQTADGWKSAHAATTADAPQKAVGASSLTVTTEPAPTYATNSTGYITSKPRSKNAQSHDTSSKSTPAQANYRKTTTTVGRQISLLHNDVSYLRNSVAKYDGRLDSINRNNISQSKSYYMIVASISAHLQSGTTPGNPELVRQLNKAEGLLNQLSQSTSTLNSLATSIAEEASKASYVLETTQATFGLSGAIDADHRNLITLEDDINHTIVRINRLLNQINDEIIRKNTYLRSERLNIQSLSLAVQNGELYGPNLSGRLFNRAASAGSYNPIAQNNTPVAIRSNGQISGRKPIIIIKFVKKHTKYKQPLYSAINKILERSPSTKFDLVAVSPSQGNAAQVSLASIDAKKNAEDVLRSLSQMGVPLERVRLNTAKSNNVSVSEIHLYTR